MANHEMKNVSHVDSGLATPPCKVERIMVASSWREVLQAELTGLLVPAGGAPGAPEYAINILKNKVLAGKNDRRPHPAARPF
jgi:hypothetical protein